MYSLVVVFEINHNENPTGRCFHINSSSPIVFFTSLNSTKLCIKSVTMSGTWEKDLLRCNTVLSGRKSSYECISEGSTLQVKFIFNEIYILFGL
jgi:hypothetical protein